ncbi:adenosylcobinamide-GDP ribazoletransferase [Butyrivibrio sp. INlla14]|uniref:adenosylcobinamide-GDP ribazoletransferase n=1 Tax=Butyrivibrio sp. INlla14 TaxID=1520808 RepID=UPI0008767258|nr:adenosylcobinamide-GDP ribazoletransferase [Butyrivibrio sp. INlla14]SCY02361.1 cobalamin-5'-phosphate synthase [Butyrivibrio sp. INlla14]
MRLLKQIAIAFSLYSRIPMPIFEWEDKDYKKAIAFLPLVGVVIGGICTAVYWLGQGHLPGVVLGLILALIPIAITGGFHLDGFMDVSDALSSYQNREKSLEIMKDPHIGAFAVIGLLKYGLCFLAALLSLTMKGSSENVLPGIMAYAIGFVIVRAFCGLTSIYLSKAKKDGMLSNETKEADLFVKIILCFFLILGAGSSLIMWPIGTVLALVAVLCYTWHYGRLCKKRFGGVTGDTAGYYICMAECVYLVAIAVSSYIADAYSFCIF